MRKAILALAVCLLFAGCDRKRKPPGTLTTRANNFNKSNVSMDKVCVDGVSYLVFWQRDQVVVQVGLDGLPMPCIQGSTP